MVFLTPNWQPRRSVLFVPAANERAVAKSAALACDAVIYDLEDSVGPGEKEASRRNLAVAFQAVPGNRERIVRVPAPDSDTFEADLGAALACRPDAILLPKIDSADSIARVRGLTGPGGPVLWAMIETPLAVIDIREISERGTAYGLEALVVGPNDLARTTGVAMLGGRAAFVPWLMSVVAAGRAFGLSVLDGVYNNFRDEAGFREECRQGAEMGFDGKTLIHPAQIETANTAFSPGQEELAHARMIVAAFEEGGNTGRGVIQIDGKMVERLHLDMARRLLEIVERHRL